ncbi:hypothetical protein K443DRAFT_15286 [Laccaria amethystina LaAM-08-1]|uniref:Uncharacterized protein n=1 Tax=Laccaria amethystina LaAM-08-1 TaxID=1095629 RepID=A0A0C9X1E2_9AGAR|nr:hypothetical protein K443DRAFT_15286 [Laccaria amethystina LaAM-08-1]
MTRSILLFSHPGDILADYSLKDGKVTDVIERLLASINEELENEHGNHNHSSPLSFHRTAQHHHQHHAPFKTPGTHTTPSWFFEEEAAGMLYSADTVDSGFRGYGCVDGGDFDRYMMEDNARSVYGPEVPPYSLTPPYQPYSKPLHLPPFSPPRSPPASSRSRSFVGVDKGDD